MTHALVTGAAGAIGSAIARALRRREPDVRLSLVDVDRAKLDEVAVGLGGDSSSATWDLAEPTALPEKVRALVAERGPIDLLVSCAGFMEIRSFCATEWALGARLLDVDLVSPLRLMALVAPSMVARRSGVIVNVSSMAGVTPLRGCAYYGAAKAGLAMASEIARLELAPLGVHVVTVYPGPVRSELERRARAQATPSVATRWIPTGEAEPLGERIVEACHERRARVVFPGIYELASRFPAIASAVTRALSPAPTDA